MCKTEEKHWREEERQNSTETYQQRYVVYSQKSTKLCTPFFPIQVFCFFETKRTCFPTTCYSNWIKKVEHYLLFILPSFVSCFVLGNNFLMFLILFTYLSSTILFHRLHFSIVLTFQLMQVFFKGCQLTFQLRFEGIPSIIHRRCFVSQHYKVEQIKNLTFFKFSSGYYLVGFLGCVPLALNSTVPHRLQ